MALITAALAVLIFVITWLAIDFSLGRKRHVKLAKRIEYPPSTGNCMLYTDGNKLFQAMFQDIKDATAHIHVLFYILREDDISHEFIQLLTKKAAEGVEVRLLLDRIGSMKLKKSTVNRLKKSGVHFSYSRKPKGPFFFYSVNRRNHRKVTVIDGKVGYLGGFNIGKEYLGYDPMLGPWKDYHLRMTGKIVHDLQNQFLMDWQEDTNKDLTEKKDYYPPLSDGAMGLQLLATNGSFMKEIFSGLIDQATSSIKIGTPYFIPDRDLLEKLVEAARNGIDITILVPMKSDHALVKEAAFPFFKKLLESGCKIYQFYQGFYHAKVIIIDDKLCDIGTANFDKRSLHLNDEMNCFIHDREFILHVSAAYQKDLQQSERLTMDRYQKRSLLHRSKEKFATAISQLL